MANEIPPSLDRSELLNALQDAQHAAVLHLVPEASARGLVGHAFWSLYWLTRGTEPHPTELARRLGMSAPACTSMVDQLVEAGFVARRPSDEDRRHVVLAVTPKGRRALEGVWGQLDSRIRAATKNLPPEELATTARILRTVATRLRADRRDP